MLAHIKAASSYLWKDHKYLKIFFLLLTLLVLFQEFVVFFIEKPTLTTVTKSQMGPDNLPVVLICPDPATDLSFLLTKGYPDTFHYQVAEWSTSMSRTLPRNCWRQLSYAIKNQLGHPKPPTRKGLWNAGGILRAPRWFFMA